MRRLVKKLKAIFKGGELLFVTCLQNVDLCTNRAIISLGLYGRVSRHLPQQTANT